MKRVITSFYFLCFSFAALHAQHTFSIVAIDAETGEIGTAGATCLSSADCGGCGGAIIITDIVAGKGAMNAQAQICIPNVNLNRGIQMIDEGMGADEVLGGILDSDPCTSGGVNDRQYGIATMGSSGEIDIVAFTGSTNSSFANHITGPNYAIQGNILIGPEVLSGMEDGFLNTSGSLAEKLMGAMQGAKIPGADSRCLADGISSRSSFLRLMPRDGGAGRLDIVIPSTINNVDPIDSLQTIFTERFVATTSVATIATNTALKMAPNPANTHIMFQHVASIFENGTIYFYDSKGALLQENNLAKNRISVKKLPIGLIFYSVFNTDRSKTTSGKIMIQR